jgi:hypothetical protein
LKRKRGLLKKAMELTLLTDSFLVVTLYDEREKRITTFQSHDVCPDFNSASVTSHEKFRPQDVSLNARAFFRLFISNLKVSFIAK